MPRHLPFIGIIRAKSRKEIDIRDSKRLCLASKGKRERFDSFVLFVVNDGRRTHHKHGVLLGAAQDRSHVRAGRNEIDSNLPVLDGRIVGAT